MTAIHDFMRDDHRHCDDHFVAVEAAVVENDWERARSEWARFNAALLRHFEMEETVLFPEIEAATGMAGGPTEVMRMDHEQMRAMSGMLETALQDGDADAFLGHSQAMMVMIQQHNMKEEQVLYPMADRALSDGSAVVRAMEDLGTGVGDSESGA